MQASVALIRLAIVVLPAVAAAQEPAPRGHHPALLARQQLASQGYDYQAKFYPHPAWMYLETDRHEMGDHPAVLVARRHAREQAQTNAEARSRDRANVAVSAGALSGHTAPAAAVR